MGACDGVGSVEHPKRLTRFCRFFERIEQSAGIGVEACANVLYVVDDCIEVQHLLRAQAALVRLIKANHWKASFGIGTIGDIFLVFRAANAMLGRKKRSDRRLRRPP